MNRVIRLNWGSLALFFALVSSLCCPSNATIVYVNKNSIGTLHDGAKWATAFTSIHPAIAAATPGDQVWVAAGTYLEDVTLADGVLVYGGFAGSETNQNQRDWKSNACIIDGSTMPANNVVTVSAGAAALDGFTICNGADGVYISASTATISNCVIRGGSSAGIYADFRGVADVSSCIVQENQGGVGTASGGLAKVAHCIISENSSWGIYASGTSVVDDSTICGNTSSGVYTADGGVSTIINCTVCGNTVGIWIAKYGAVPGKGTVTNCIVASNQTGIGRADATCSLALSHNDVVVNSGANYAGIKDPTGADGNISEDPKLSSVYHDIHIQPGSACVDAGDDSAATPDQKDVYGKPRIIGAHVDIGSDESDGTIWNVPSRTWYVAQTGSDTNDGTSWTSAKQTVKAGLAVSQGSDEVWIAKGTYKENIVIPVGVALYGGFAGVETSRIQRDWNKNACVLDGQGKDVFTVPYLASSIDGLVIRAGGYGVYDNSGTVSISHCTFTGNSGEAVYVFFGAANVAQCVMSGNAGGVFVDASGTAVVANCTMSANGYGIGSDGKTTIVNCNISGNTDGVGVNEGLATLTNCTISGNRVGISLENGIVVITNSIVAENWQGIALLYNFTPVVTYSHNDVYGNYSANFSDIANPTGTNGNISRDPMLSNTYHDVHLQPGSPCINAGDDTVVTPIETDVYGKPRKIGSHVDIGADESDGATWTLPSRILHVAQTGDDAEDGTSWATAKRTIAACLAAAQSPDEVWVAAGTYPETVTVPPGVSMYGGFAGGETARDQRNWNSSIATISGPGETIVRIPYLAAVLDGFALSNGGTGILASGTAVVANCRINTSIRDGILVHGGAASVTNCDLSGNSYSGITAESGGSVSAANCSISKCGTGIAVHDAICSVDRCNITGNLNGVSGNATITNCTISGNSTYGVVLFSGASQIDNCTISGSASYGLYVGQTGLARVSRCVFSGNATGVSGSTTLTDCVVSGSTYGVVGKGSITNCTVTDNTYGVVLLAGTTNVMNCIAAFNATGYYLESKNAVLTMAHCDAFGNTGANFTNTTDRTGMNGNISADPRFVNRVGGDFRLLPGSPCIDAGDDSATLPGDRDLGGLPRVYGTHVDMGAYEWQPPRLSWSVSLGTAVEGGVAVAEKVAYIGGNDGKLYALSTEDGSSVVGFPVPGFPVDINAAVGATVRLPSRPAVYYGKTGKAIYLTTDRGDVVRILPDGEIAWHVRPLTGQTVSTPAVTPDGNVYVNLSTGSGPFNNYVFKLDEATGTPLSLSPFLGYTTADNIGDFSPAANGRYLYVNAGWGSKSGLTLLNQDNLAVRSSFAGGEQCLSPLLLGSDLLLASKSGKAWKMNSVTLTPDLGFGHFGVADLGTPISAAPFSDAAGNVYIGTADGRILKWVPGTGAFTPFYTATGKVSGLTINRTAGVLGFGTSSGSFIQVPLGNPAGATTVTPGGPISTGTVYEALTDRFIVVTDTGILSGYPLAR